jgi:orotate phosphoribosyltransferase
MPARSNTLTGEKARAWRPTRCVTLIGVSDDQLFDDSPRADITTPADFSAPADFSTPADLGDDPAPDGAAKARLAELVNQLAVVHGKVTLSSGREADYYVDLRRATLHHEAGPLIGILLRQLTADWDFDAVGGLTLGADPVATAMMHAPGQPLNAFVVRKEAKAHGMQRRIEGPDVQGRRVLVVEDTTTTGASPLKAVEALREVGAEVVGVATIVDRGTGADQVIADAGLSYRYLLGLDDLGLPPM